MNDTIDLPMKEMLRVLLKKYPDVPIEEGWTPPKEKQPEWEPQPGDWVLVSSDEETWNVRRLYSIGKSMSHPYICYNDTSRKTTTAWKYCKPFPTWLHWETGDMPRDELLLLEDRNGSHITSNSYNVAFDGSGRWARLPIGDDDE